METDKGVCVCVSVRERERESHGGGESSLGECRGSGDLGSVRTGAREKWKNVKRVEFLNSVK